MPISINRREFIISMAGFFLLESGKRKKRIRNKRQWERARQQLLIDMQEVMGSLPTITAPPHVIVHSTEDLPLFMRIRISYESEPGDYVPSYLLIPKLQKEKYPAMLCLHQTTNYGKDEPAGVGGDAELYYAKELAERGYVCIVPDYPYLGENTFDPYQNGYVSGSMKGIVNHMRAIDVLQSLPEVNSEYIGVIGHSLGGHNSLFLSVFDSRVKAIVTSCGFTTKRHYARGAGSGDLAGWSGVRYMPKIATEYNKDPERVPFDFPEILVAIAPRPVFINAPLHDDNFDVQGVKECVSAATSVYKRVFKADDKLVVAYPDAGHAFPGIIRNEAYDFLNRWSGNA